MDAAGKVFGKAAGDFHGEARFANPARAGDGEQADVGPRQKFSGRASFFFAADEAGARNRKVGARMFGWLGRFFGETVANGGELARKIARGNIAAVGGFGEAAFDDPAQRSRGFAIIERDGFDRFAENGHHGFGGSGPLKGALASDHFVEHRAQGKLIGAEVQALAAGLLRRHVTDGTKNGAGRGVRSGGGDAIAFGGARGNQFGQTKIEDFHQTILRDHQVFRLQIAVSDAGFMGFGEAFGNLHRNFERSAHREPAGDQ